jgi:hypothetical protein
MQELTPPQLSGVKLGSAVLLQLGIVVGVYAYVAWLKRHPFPLSFHKAWHVRPIQILTIVWLGALSATLFYNGAVCGDKPLPTVRGVGLCN